MPAPFALVDAAAPFGNGSFEVPVIEAPYVTLGAGETIGPWNVTAGDVDLQFTWARAEDGRQSVDMSGFVGGKICQSFTTTTGATYDVSFWMSRNTAGGLTSASLAAIVTDIKSVSFTHDEPTDNTAPRWEQHVLSFTATGDSSELCFESTDPPVGSGPDGAAMLDNVTILDVTPPTVSLATPAVASTTGDATPAFSGTAGDALGDSTTVTVKVYGGSNTSGPLVQTITTTRSGSSWSVEGSSPLAPGTYTAQAEQGDAAGNVGFSSPSTFTVTDEIGGGGAGGGSGASQVPGPPTVGETFNAETVSGVVTFRCGSGRQRPLEEAEQLPIGCRIDARRGHVRVTSAAGNGNTQSAVFSAGVFTVKQKARAKPVTELRLVGKLENCPRRRSTSSAGAARAFAPAKSGRRLWGRGKGVFRTRGRRSAATVTGTRWLVADRCDGSTLTKVTVGTVEVRDFVRARTITLKRGQSYVARPRSRNRR